MSVTSSRPDLLLGEVRNVFVEAFIVGYLLPPQKVCRYVSEIGASGGNFFYALSRLSAARTAMYCPSSPVISFLMTREAPLREVM